MKPPRDWAECLGLLLAVWVVVCLCACTALGVVLLVKVALG